MARGLTDLGVQDHLAVDPEHVTGTVVALVHADDRDMYTSRGAAAALAPADLSPGWLDGVDHLHLSGYALLSADTRPAGLAALEQAAAAGATISVDPASAGPLRQVGVEAFLAWLPPGTLLTPNLVEARLLTGREDPVAAAHDLAERCGEAAITLGARGAVWSDGRDVVRSGAQAVAAGDPVGAGDAFTAGLLATRRQGGDIAAQLRHGCLTAGRAVRGERPVSRGGADAR